MPFFSYSSFLNVALKRLHLSRPLYMGLLSGFLVVFLISPIRGDNVKRILPKDSVATYVTKQLKQAKLAKKKDLNKAISITEDLLNDPLVISNDSILNYIKYRHSLNLLLIDENRQSKEMIQDILDYYEEKNIKRWTNLKSRLGLLEIRLGDYDKAGAHLKEALPYAQQLEMPITEGLIYLSLSKICRYKSDFGDAFRKADLGLQIFKKINRTDWILEANTTLAYICVLAKDYDGAAQYFDKIFDKEKNVSNDNFLVSPTLYAGIMNFEKGDIALAKKQMKQGLERINSLGNFPDLTVVYQYMSHISRIEKDYATAEEYALKAIATTAKSYNKRHTLNARLTLIKLETIIRPQKSNLENLKEVYQWAIDHEDYILLKESSNLIATHYIAQGNYKKALTYNKVYISASEEKFRKDHLNEIAIIKEKSKYLQEVKEREMKAQKLQLQLASSETRRIMMLISMLFLILISGILYLNYTQKKQAYAALKQKNQKLKDAEQGLEFKNKELERYIAYNLQLENFAYIASHDLKSPLQTISNFSQLLQTTAKERLKEEEQQFLEFISQGTEDMTAIVNDILDFSLLQKSQLIKEKIEVSTFVEYVLQLNESIIKDKKATVSLNLKTPYISGDRSKLLQLLQNLITNSVKFHRKNQLPKVTISSHADQNNWFFDIEDNGIGIEPSYFNKIFLLFKRLHRKEEYEGTGIGLSLCKKIVEMHGGKIWVKSTIGEGSTFSFSLPK